MATPGGEQAVAQDNLEKARKLIEDLEKKGCQVSEARGWFDQAKDMFRSGLFRTSIIYSGYALDAGNEMVQKIKEMVLRVTKVKARAVDQLGKDNKNMPRIDEMITEMKKAINEGRLEDCQELISEVDELLRGGSSPYLSTTRGRSEIVKTVQPSRGYSSCSSCGNIVESSWIKCKYCGQDLKEEEGGGGPAWASGDGGPHLVSDRQADDEGEDKGTSEDMKEMERTEEDMDRVGSDLDRTETEMVKETERTADEKTRDDMKDQEAIEKEEERTEADLEAQRPVPLPPALPPPLPPALPPRKTADEETSKDMVDQEAIERSMENVEADLEKAGPDLPVSAGPVTEKTDIDAGEQDAERQRKELLNRLNGWREVGYDVTRLEKIIDSDLSTLRPEFERYAKDVEKLEALTVRFKRLKDPRLQKIEPFLKRPDEVQKLEKVIIKIESTEGAKPAEGPKPAPAVETKPTPSVEPAPNPPAAEAKPVVEEKKAGVPAPEAPRTEPKPETPKRFFIPPPPMITFDDYKLPPLSSKPPAGQTKCPSCGEEVEADFLKCPFCKAALKK